MTIKSCQTCLYSDFDLDSDTCAPCLAAPMMSHPNWTAYKDEADDITTFGDAALPPAVDELVDHPAHYTSHASGVECIQITEHMNFCCGNAIKYIWRAGEKGDAITDLKKARWYLDREIARLEKTV